MDKIYFEYLKKLSKKEFFAINLCNTILGIIIIVLAILGLYSGMTMVVYGFMFAAGAILMLLNFYKGMCTGRKNKWIFLAAGLLFIGMSVVFFYAMMR